VHTRSAYFEDVWLRVCCTKQACLLACVLLLVSSAPECMQVWMSPALEAHVLAAPHDAHITCMLSSERTAAAFKQIAVSTHLNQHERVEAFPLMLTLLPAALPACLSSCLCVLRLLTPINHQGVRAAGEADDAPLDESDLLQVAARLRLLWSDWRKLSSEQQRSWGDKQLGGLC
jgi:hypothetical protein